MKILRKGTLYEKDALTYRFNCKACGSKLQAKRYELRAFGFKNSQSITQDSYAFTCPVCNCRRIVYAKDMKRVTTVKERIDDTLNSIIKKVNKSETISE